MKKKALLMTGVIIFIAIISTAQQTGTFTDYRDGKTYKTAKIGSQTWMAENLAYKTSSGCWAYDNKIDNVKTYGYLYDWETAKKACPTGWHLPSDKEWTELVEYLGGDFPAGCKLKETGTTHWNGHNILAHDGLSHLVTNESGFTALPGGLRRNDGIFYYIGSYGYWWSASEKNTFKAWRRYIDLLTNFVTRNYVNKENGFSVRCLKD